METTTQKRKIVLYLLAFLWVFTQPALAQKGFVGDGFGGRKWYKPGNFIAGDAGLRPNAAVLNGQLYLWGHTGYPDNSSGPSTPVNMAENWGYPSPYNPVNGAGAATGYRTSVTPYAVAGMTNVKMVSLSSTVLGLLKNDGTAWLWGGGSSSGANDFYKVGPNPTQVQTNVYHMSVGLQHAAFVKTDGTVWCLGYNTDGNFGNGTTSATSSTVTATQMTGMTNAVRVVATRTQTSSAFALGTLVLKRDGTVWVAGANNSLINSGSNYTASQIPGLSNVVDIKAGTDYAVALTASGEVYSWGQRYNGNLGNGDWHIPGFLYTPVKVVFPAGTTPMVAIEANGPAHLTYSIDEEGTLWCWGNDANHLSGGSIGGNFPTPIISTRHVADVSMYSTEIAYLTRNADYPADQRVWFIIGQGGSYKINALSPNEAYAPLTSLNQSTFPQYDAVLGGNYPWSYSKPEDAGLPGAGIITPTTSVSGTVDCGTASIIGNLVPGKPSDVMLKITATVSTTGTGTFIVSGSGLTTKDSPETFTADATGSQTFYLPMSYDGSALGATTFTLSGLGSCSADLSGLNKRTVPTPITPLVNCVPFTSVTLSK